MKQPPRGQKELEQGRESAFLAADGVYSEGPALEDS